MSAGGHFETRPINIYALSRIHEEAPFNIVERHSSQKRDIQRTKAHEIESLRLFVDALLSSGATLDECYGFFYSFHIPQIGKEFDLLKFTDKLCLNVELKSVAVPEEQILSQLLKNRHYLSHLGKRLALYAIKKDGRYNMIYPVNRDFDGKASLNPSEMGETQFYKDELLKCYSKENRKTKLFVYAKDTEGAEYTRKAGTAGKLIDNLSK